MEATSAQSVFATLILHAISLLISFYLFSKSVDFTIVLKILTNDKLQPADVNKIIETKNWILGYFLLIFSLAYSSGIFLQKIIFKLNPYKTSFLAFNLPWYYELKGKIEPPKLKHQNKNIHEFIRVTCMIVSGRNTYLYSGLLDDFYLNTDGSLDRIAITEISRIELKNNNHNGVKEAINVGRMILKYSEIQNLTIQYLLAIKDS